MFKLSGFLEGVQSLQKDATTDSYLCSGLPFASQNVFQALEGDTSLKGVIPYLPASRLSHIPANSHTSRSGPLPLKTVSRTATRAYIALSAKFHSQRAQSSSHDASVLASLDLEIPAYAQHAIVVDSVEIDFPSGQITPITPSSILGIPKHCQPRDNIILLYNLTPDQVYTNQSLQPVADSVRLVNVSISAKVLVSSVCSPTLLLHWRTTVDFSPAQTANTDRPRSFLRGQNSRIPVDPNPAIRASVDNERPGTIDFAISATLPAIDNVRVGEPFHWEIFLVNRSAITRSLSVAVITRGSGLTSTRRPILRQKEGSNDAAPAHIDESALHDLTRNKQLDPSGLVCLGTNLNVE